MREFAFLRLCVCLYIVSIIFVVFFGLCKCQQWMLTCSNQSMNKISCIHHVSLLLDYAYAIYMLIFVHMYDEMMHYTMHSTWDLWWN